MSTYTRVIVAAKEDAERFASEYPGKQILPDWETTAWADTAQKLGLSDEEASDYESTYQDALEYAIDSKLMYVRYIGNAICYTILATGGFVIDSDVDDATKAVRNVCDAGGGVLPVNDSIRMIAAWDDRNA